MTSLTTIPTLENKGLTEELFTHNIECPTNKILKKYKFTRLFKEDPKKIQYTYECIDNPNPNNNFINKQTMINDYGNGKNIFLDRHKIECPPGHALSKIQLTGQIQTDPKQIQYNYRCTDANINTTKSYLTQLNDEGNSIIFFDRHDIKCPDNSFLTSVKLNRKLISSEPKKYQFKFDYTCGESFVMPQSFKDIAVTEPSPKAVAEPSSNINLMYDYNTSTMLDEDGKTKMKTSHIKASIQNLILYYGLYTENRDVDMIFSKGGEIATNLVENIKAYIIEQKIQYNWRATQSDSWCALIWKALQIAGRKINPKWTIFTSAQPIIDLYAEEFARMPGWVDYADYILTTYKSIQFGNSFDNQIMQNESKKIKLYLRLMNTPNIIDKKTGMINQNIENIIQFYAGDITNYDTFIKTQMKYKNIFDTFDRTQISLIIWKTLKIAGYPIPDGWIRKENSEKIDQFANELAQIKGFAEFILFSILDYIYIDAKYTDKSKYILHQNDIYILINTEVDNTKLTVIKQIELLYNIKITTFFG
jgi:hypothetical protein